MVVETVVERGLVQLDPPGPAGPSGWTYRGRKFAWDGMILWLVAGDHPRPLLEVSVLELAIEFSVGFTVGREWHLVLTEFDQRHMGGGN